MITLLQAQLDVSFIRKEVAADLLQLQRGWEMDALNNEVDVVRAGQINVSNMVADPKNHFYSL